MLSKLFKRKNKSFIYTILDEPFETSVLGVWEKHLFHFNHVIGYSATGTIFLYSEETQEYFAFYPSMPGNNSKNYGIFKSIDEFEEKILKEKTFPEHCLYPINPKDLKYIESKLGYLNEGQIYYPKLDPVLGGNIELDGFDKGNIWVRTDIIGQNRGIE